MENSAKPSTQALDAFAEWMQRVDARLRMLEGRADLAKDRIQRCEDWAATVKHHGDQIDGLLGDIERNRKLVARIEALEAKAHQHLNDDLSRKHWGVTDGQPDPTVQLRRDVGTLVRAARELVHKIKPYTPHWSTDPVEAALKAFEGDYT